MSDDLVRRLKAIEVQPIDQFGRWLTNIHAEAAAEIERLAVRIATLEAALQRLAQWADAYPPSAFPPDDR